MIFFICCECCFSQQWIDLQYSYDSLLNVSYGKAINFNGEEVNLSMDIFVPTCINEDQKTDKPLLMWIHGGSFLAGDKNDVSIQQLCRQFARRGYITASVDYRLGFVSDDIAWNCNYPNYNCVFASDSAEWVRAYYRAVQDCKGALRFLINRHEAFGIDTNNVFIAGESAGAFTALGVGLMDSENERPLETFQISDVPSPSTNALSCIYNQGLSFNNSVINRPDLGDIDGSIEPTSIHYTIKGIGNMYGAMLSDLLKEIPDTKTKPAIYSFHQPCDIVVPFDSNYVNWGVSWCFTNGYNCFGIINNEVMLYGSNIFTQWNIQNNYGYNILHEFSNISFPFNFLFGQGSCLDQINNPCHAYDDKSLREKNMANFFAKEITSTYPCDNNTSTSWTNKKFDQIKIYPNPATDIIFLKNNFTLSNSNLLIYNNIGQIIKYVQLNKNEELSIEVSDLPKGIYFLKYQNSDGLSQYSNFVKY